MVVQTGILIAMQWSEVVDFAQRAGWTTFIGTADAQGAPHVAIVAPGFTDGTVWFATRASSRKYRNLRENPRVAFHWPIDKPNEAPGELAAWGDATILHDSRDARERVWNAQILPYDLGGFWGSPDNPDLVFVEAPLRRALLRGPDLVARVWNA